MFKKGDYIMVLLALLLFIICLIGAEKSSYNEEIYGTFAGIFGFVWVLGLPLFGVLLFRASYVVPSKIAMYEEENARIESQISSTVQHYMEYEKDIIYKVSDDESAIELVSLYPELSSDTLVSKEIDAYTKNNEAIKELKNAELNKPIWKFLLFFGH